MRLINSLDQIVPRFYSGAFLLFWECISLKVGHFYFLENQYFIDFNDDKLMSNHEAVNNVTHDRPCYCCLKLSDTDIYWGIPISSQVEKYKDIYNKKVARYGVCDTIEFGNVLGREKAFLIQNMCPITDKYIKNEYLHEGAPVAIDRETHTRIQKKASKVLALLHHSKVNLIFPNVREIEEALKKL